MFNFYLDQNQKILLIFGHLSLSCVLHWGSEALKVEADCNHPNPSPPPGHFTIFQSLFWVGLMVDSCWYWHAFAIQQLRGPEVTIIGFSDVDWLFLEQQLTLFCLFKALVYIGALVITEWFKAPRTVICCTLYGLHLGFWALSQSLPGQKLSDTS